MMFITEHNTAALASTSDSPVAERLRCPTALESGVVVSSDPLFVPLLGTTIEKLHLYQSLRHGSSGDGGDGGDGIPR